MHSTVTIGGAEVKLAWTQDIARRMPFRVSKLGGGPRFADFTHPKKAAAAVTEFLWLILPPADHARFSTPEELFAAIAEDEAPAIHAAIFAVIAEMTPDAEKKSTGGKTHSPGSNWGSVKPNGNPSTQTKPQPTSPHGKSGRNGSRSATHRSATSPPSQAD